jgi:DNA-binding response OmpR family regulator
MRATKRGNPIALTAFEFKLLQFLLKNPDRVITREELLSAVWGYIGPPATRTVDNQILKLRQKVEDDPADPVYFSTVHGVGYRFVLVPQQKS